MNGLHHLVPLCVEDDETRFEWISCIDKYKETTEKLSSRKHFEFIDICSFQKSADEFCEIYFRLTGRHGMTNYFHCLYAGHFSYFLRRYGSLYKYSQQGWENVNGVLKRSFHNNTQKGGGRGGTSKLLPVFERFGRGLLWRSGHGDGLMERLGFGKKDRKKIEFGKIPKSLKYSDVDQEIVQAYAETIMKLGTDEDILGPLEAAL